MLGREFPVNLRLDSGRAVQRQLLPGFQKRGRQGLHKISVGHKEVPVTHLRKLMLEELQRLNYAQNTVRTYINDVERFARHFDRSPERLVPAQIREYQVNLFRSRF